MEKLRRASGDRILLFLILFEASLAILALIAGWFSGFSVLHLINGKINSLLWSLPLTLILAVGVLLLIRVPIPSLRKMEVFLEDNILPYFSGLSLLDLFLISLLSGFSEELLFRGFLQHYLSSVLEGPWPLLAVGFIFGLLHYASFAYFLIATGMGFYLGWLFWVSDNLMVPILSHTFYNFILFAYYFRIRSSSSDENGDPPGSDDL